MPPAVQDGPALGDAGPRIWLEKIHACGVCPGRQRRRSRRGGFTAALGAGGDKRGLAMGAHHALARQLRPEGHPAIAVGAKMASAIIESNDWAGCSGNTAAAKL